MGIRKARIAGGGQVPELHRSADTAGFRHGFNQPVFGQFDKLLARSLTCGAKNLSCIRRLLWAAGF
ncbi:hypothetical protein D3C71_2015180 [compost metagenome]